MILTRTPFRITLGGGGTDLPSFYAKHGGYVLAAGIDKYMYVALNVPAADRLVRLHYTQSETVARTRELRHDLAREALLRHGFEDAVEVASLADLPAGTGLGSSSCYLVGLLNAVRNHIGASSTPEELASEACDIELNVLHKPIGKQDQYMAAFGGLTELRVDRDGSVRVDRLSLPAGALEEFVRKTHLYYTHLRRDAIDILARQDAELRATSESNVESAYLEIKAIGEAVGEAFRACDFDRFGALVHEHWLAKKRLSPDVTVEPMERLYDSLRAEYGVLGGKIAGAGGGGFMMLYCAGDGAALTQHMAGLGFERLNWAIDPQGSRIA